MASFQLPIKAASLKQSLSVTFALVQAVLSRCQKHRGKSGQQMSIALPNGKALQYNVGGTDSATENKLPALTCRDGKR